MQHISHALAQVLMEAQRNMNDRGSDQLSPDLTSLAGEVAPLSPINSGESEEENG